MHDWYEKGLIGAEYVFNSSIGVDEEAFLTEETSAMLYYYSGVEDMEALIGGQAEFCAVPFPVMREGEVSQAVISRPPIIGICTDRNFSERITGL